MKYTFRSDEGETRTFEFEMSRVPIVGSKVRRDGQWWTRIIDVPAALVVRGDCKFESYSRPPFDPRFPDVDPVSGRGRFHNKRQVREYLAKVNEEPMHPSEAHGLDYD